MGWLQPRELWFLTESLSVVEVCHHCLALSHVHFYHVFEYVFVLVYRSLCVLDGHLWVVADATTPKSVSVIVKLEKEMEQPAPSHPSNTP